MPCRGRWQSSWPQRAGIHHKRAQPGANIAGPVIEVGGESTRTTAQRLFQAARRQREAGSRVGPQMADGTVPSSSSSPPLSGWRISVVSCLVSFGHSQGPLVHWHCKQTPSLDVSARSLTPASYPHQPQAWTPAGPRFLRGRQCTNVHLYRGPLPPPWSSRAQSTQPHVTQSLAVPSLVPCQPSCTRPCNVSTEPRWTGSSTGGPRDRPSTRSRPVRCCSGVYRTSPPQNTSVGRHCFASCQTSPTTESCSSSPTLGILDKTHTHRLQLLLTLATAQKVFVSEYTV